MSVSLTKKQFLDCRCWNGLGICCTLNEEVKKLVLWQNVYDTRNVLPIGNNTRKQYDLFEDKINWLKVIKMKKKDHELNVKGVE